VKIVKTHALPYACAEMAERELTKGARELPKRRKVKAHLQRDCAAIIGVAQATVSRWEAGIEAPRAAERSLIEAIYGIPSYWWEPEAVRRHIEATFRAARKQKR
jgi:DNA-binding transcriptional regulator YiaG